MSSDIHALSGAYAVDALDDQEREAFERHLTGCSACQAEVSSLQEAAATLADTVALTPPAHLRDAVLAGAGSIRPLPPVISPLRRRPARHVVFVGSLIAAAVIALLFVWVRPHGPAPTYSAAQISHASDAVAVTQHLPSGATVTWYRSVRLNAAAVSVTGLPPVAAGKTYELWLQSPDGVMHAAGRLPSGTRTVVLTGPAGAAMGAGLTVEPATGSTTPTLPPVTVASFPSA